MPPTRADPASRRRTVALSDPEAPSHTPPRRTLNTAGVAKDWHLDSCFIYFPEARPDRQGEGLPLSTVQRWVLSGKMGVGSSELGSFSPHA